jgi:oligopeptide transport system substrate-binding protein
VPNERYWNKDNVHLSKITFLPIEDERTALDFYEKGAVDWLMYPPEQLMETLKRRSDFHVSPQLGTYFYYINTRDPVLKDARIRKALSLAINRKELIEKVVTNGALPAVGLAPTSGDDYRAIDGTGYNVAEAQRLLAEAGYPNGRGLPTISVIYNTLEAHRLIAEYLQQVWKNTLGVNVTLQNLEWATFLDTRRTSRMQLGRAGWIADYDDPMSLLELLISSGGNNDGYYSDPEYDRLLRQAAAMPGGAERNALLRQAEKIAITRDQAVIPLYNYAAKNLIDTGKWDGWYTNPKDLHPYVGLKRK